MLNQIINPVVLEKASELTDSSSSCSDKNSLLLLERPYTTHTSTHHALDLSGYDRLKTLQGKRYMPNEVSDKAHLEYMWICTEQILVFGGGCCILALMMLSLGQSWLEAKAEKF